MQRHQDHYARKAKEAGFPARSVYKLEEIQKRFSVLRAGMRVLEIGSAPGSWTILTARIVGPGGRIVAVDLKAEYRPIKGPEFVFLHGDLHDEAIRTEIAGRAPFDCILSDAAPSTTGNRTVDSSRSAAIAEAVLALCDLHLERGGNLTVKLFQGADQAYLLGEVRKRFSTAKQFKPQASRKESFEVYCIGIGFLRESR